MATAVAKVRHKVANDETHKIPEELMGESGVAIVEVNPRRLADVVLHTDKRRDLVN